MLQPQHHTLCASPARNSCFAAIVLCAASTLRLTSWETEQRREEAREAGQPQAADGQQQITALAGLLELLLVQVFSCSIPSASKHSCTHCKSELMLAAVRKGVKASHGFVGTKQGNGSC
jgi:hypothetical protein